ncbi:LOW QUALITY PROTEIN: hypothetical protein CVT26_002331 [Gymnopilus dilepis]|uniref:Uncharacterized protein n=1 Tax=Gymnopilus dilepis TaxID=231916 RepID=A0A409Y3C3_9AGAR|nr:LOW QUALITY PROTEIN: hypothetical protein CVT26_002331 [Gymnopilus dilepis]
MDGFQFQFSLRPGLDGLVKESSPALEQISPIQQTVPAGPPNPSQIGNPVAMNESLDNQLVLHASRRRRRASRELTPDLGQASSSSAGGGWRPVRLQGYSEDPMKDEVIRGQKEMIKLLQAQAKVVQIQLRDLQMDHSNYFIADQRAAEAEEALRCEQDKVERQEDMLHQLRTELRIAQEGVGQHVEGERSYQQELEFQEDRREEFQSNTLDIGSPSLPTQEDSPMNFDLFSSGRTGLGGGDTEASRTAPAPERTTNPTYSVPLPLSFKRFPTQRRKKKVLTAAAPIIVPTPPLWTEIPPPPSASPSSANPVTSLEAKVDLIMNSLGIAGGKISPLQRRDTRFPARDFRSPRIKVSKAEGRNERLASTTNYCSHVDRYPSTFRLGSGLLGIRQDRDILNARDSLYIQNHPLKQRMAQFEKNKGPGPSTLEPLEVNWDIVYGRWNEGIFALFLTHCRENGYGNGQITEEDEDEISEIFFNRLERIQGIINEYRPKPDETLEQADQRYQIKHLTKLSVARRNRRRGELFNTRCDINIEHLPEDLAGPLAESTKRWIDCYTINEAFGIEGTSSDETDSYDSDAYHVHSLKWRNWDLAKKLKTTDSARRTTNAYGNSRPGNRPHIRKRRSREDSKESSRKVPTGLPINCYEESWYNGLSSKKKRELQAKPAFKLVANWDSD